MKQSLHKIAIVLDKEFGGKLIELSKRMHVWVCDTPINLKVVNEIRSNKEFSIESGVTTFKIPEADSPEDIFVKIIDTVDLHHGELSHDPPWSVLEAYGTKLSSTIEAKLQMFGKGRVEQTTNGFIFYRGSESHPLQSKGAG